MLNVVVGVFVAAILMGLLLPAGGGGNNVARKSMALNDVTLLGFAVRAYHTDYGVNPVDPSVHWNDRAIYGLPGGEHHNFELINTLRADGSDPGPNHGNSLNPHKTVYLDLDNVKDPTHPRSGLGTGTEINGRNIAVAGEWYDPWGNPYMCIIDTSGKGISDLGFIYSDIAAPNSIKPPVEVLGITFGPDGMPGNGGDGRYAKSDDIVRSGTMNLALP